jgi:hypothetical protein
LKPFRTPRSLEKMAGYKPRCGPGEEGEDQEARPPLHRPDGGPGGEGPALEGLGNPLS